MKRHHLLIILLVLVIALVGCGRKSDNINDNTSNDSFVNDRYPSFVVETVSAGEGEKDVVVLVSIENNPGFLTMAMNVAYDSEYLTLTKVLNGIDYSEYNFIGPRNTKSGCTASWFLPEIPENIVDGNILELHFDINEYAPKGVYSIEVTRPVNGGVVDQNKQAIIFNNATGYIKIE